jgi:hypothetical protein
VRMPPQPDATEIRPPTIPPPDGAGFVLCSGGLLVVWANDARGSAIVSSANDPNAIASLLTGKFMMILHSRLVRPAIPCTGFYFSLRLLPSVSGHGIGLNSLTTGGTEGHRVEPLGPLPGTLTTDRTIAVHGLFSGCLALIVRDRVLPTQGLGCAPGRTTIPRPQRSDR